MITNKFQNSKHRFEFYINYNKKTWQAIKKETNCTAILNLGYYSMSAYSKARTRQEVLNSTECDFILDGKPLVPLKYNEYGLCINSNGELSIGTPQGQTNYCVGLPPQYINGKIYCVNKPVEKNGCTHIGFTKDGTIIPLLEPKSTNNTTGMTNAQANKVLLDMGCVDIFRYDGSWSTQGDLADGLICQPSQHRIVQSYLLIFKRKTEKTIYRVQVGAFTTKWRADALSDKLKSEGYQTIVVDNKLTKTSSQKLIYRVQVGAFETKSLAEALEQKLKSEGYPTFLTNVKIMI